MASKRDVREVWKTKIRIYNLTARECLAETFGTCILLVFGYGSVVQLVMGGPYYPLLAVNFAWGFAVSISVWVTGSVSGAHINPAVTVALAVIGKFPWRKVPHYLLGQYIGAFVAATIVYGVYYEALENFDGGVRITSGVNATAGIFVTFPKPYLSVQEAIFDQLVGTGLLLIGILAMTDPRNSLRPPPGLLPLCVGFIVTCIGMCFCYNMGYPINPARDFASRVFIAMAGWGKKPFSVNNYNYFWIPVAGPHLGGILGAVLYELFIGIHLPDPDDNQLNKSKDCTCNVSSAENEEKLATQLTPTEEVAPKPEVTPETHVPAEQNLTKPE